MQNFARKTAYYLWSIVELLTGLADPWLIIRVFLHSAPPGRQIIVLRGRSLKFIVRSPMDVWSVKETFLDRFYERYGTKVGQGWRIVDIGAAIGEFTIYAACAHAQNQVYAFEPFHESYELLEQNLSINNIRNVRTYPQAISSQTGTLALNLSASEPLQIQSGVRLDDGSGVTVSCLSLADALESLGIETCDLLKLDCEGAEYAILLNAPDDALLRIHRIVMEYHDGVTQYKHTDLAAHLANKGYQVNTYPNPVHKHLGYLYASLPGLPEQSDSSTPDGLRA